MIKSLIHSFLCGADYLGSVKPEGGCFSKKVRNTLIPGQVVRHARSLTIKINYRIKEVLDKFEKFYNDSRVFFDST